ncbi:P-loop containing nucleoside triphosphate hydrolase protein [Phycomyces nitens]|nr:P-loop containing nucleoside triphosphate hydrolase protein [Phycomyces nitens]
MLRKDSNPGRLNIMTSASSVTSGLRQPMSYPKTFNDNAPTASPTSPGSFHTRLPQPQSTTAPLADSSRLPAPRSRRPSVLTLNKSALTGLQERPSRTRTVSDVGRIESSSLQRTRVLERRAEVRRSLLVDQDEPETTESSDEEAGTRRYRASAPLLDAYGVPSASGIKTRASMGALKYSANTVMPPSDLNQKIRVCVRKRPMNKKEVDRSEKDIAPLLNSRSIQINEPKLKLDLTRYIEQHTFVFDDVFDGNSKNTSVYERTALPLVEYMFEGGRATCFAYGQTGSGKTFTMLDPNHGLYVLAAKDIFTLLKKPENEHLSAWIGLYEIYQGHIYDLLNERKKIYAREDAKRNVIISGLREYPIDNVSNLIQVFEFGSNERSTGSTVANDSSSRSHAVLQILLKPKKNRKKIFGKLSFIDLAGSERGADRGETDIKTRMEGAEINKSLLALKECIRALDQDKRHTPFRQSQLTQVLKDSFVGKSRTCMIATISPGGSNSEHTLNTLRYADRVKELKGAKNRHGTTTGKGKESVPESVKMKQSQPDMDPSEDFPEESPEGEEYTEMDSNEEYYSNDDSDILDEETFNVEEENIFDVDFPHEQDALIRSSAFASPSHKLANSSYSTLDHQQHQQHLIHQQFSLPPHHSMHLATSYTPHMNQWSSSSLQSSQLNRPFPIRPSIGGQSSMNLPYPQGRMLGRSIENYNPSSTTNVVPVATTSTTSTNAPNTQLSSSPGSSNTGPIELSSIPQFNYQQMDEFVKFHRAEIREATECTKRESKLVANISLDLSSNQDYEGVEMSSDDPQSLRIALHRKVKSSHQFQKYLLDLDDILERKMAAVEALRDRIDETVNQVEL